MTAQQGVTSQQIFNMLMESQYWPPEKMVAYQRSQLEQLLRHAKANVPFYETRLDCVFRKDGSIDWDRWEEIPVLTRNEASENFEAMQTLHLPNGHGPSAIVSTSGSTGVPVLVNHTWLSSIVNSALDWRAHTWWGLDWTRNSSDWQSRTASSGEGQRHLSNGSWGPTFNPKPMQGNLFVVDFNTTLEERLEHLRKDSIAYVASQPGLLYALALELLEKGLHVPIAQVTGVGGAFESEFRDPIAQAFGASLRSIYSSTEAGRMAHSCENELEFHVNSEAVFLEIVADDRLPDQSHGHVVVTPLFSSAQPFIRYDQGDISGWAAPCTCGRQLPKLQKIQGRQQQFFTRRDGRLFLPYVPDKYRKQLGAELWQFEQSAIGHLVVKYKPLAARDRQAESHFTATLLGLLKEQFNVTYEIVDSLTLTKSGKYLKYLNSVSRSNS